MGKSFKESIDVAILFQEFKWHGLARRKGRGGDAIRRHVIFFLVGCQQVNLVMVKKSMKTKLLKLD